VLQGIYGLSALSYGLAFGAASAGFLAGNMVATRIVMRLGLDRTIGVGALALTIGGLGSVMAVVLGGASAIPLVACMTIFATGMGLVQPQTIAGAMMPFPHRAGTASSLVGVSQMLCAAVSGIVVGHFLGSSAWPVAIPLALSGALTFAIWALSREVRAREARH
jgi:DHA1 family bicyclomycin/chloramphenicol resistance-like MFS transporter